MAGRSGRGLAEKETAGSVVQRSYAVSQFFTQPSIPQSSYVKQVKDMLSRTIVTDNADTVPYYCNYRSIFVGRHHMQALFMRISRVLVIHRSADGNWETTTSCITE